ncbi:MAG TPA: hypothetical protein VE980_16950 [Pyrinomonadaceae bacterium]|nr:hypothetical protein [Pyrinomonadaceae bacterium]
MIYPILKYLGEIEETFSTLFPLFQKAGNGWQVGNVFDTLLEYVVRYTAPNVSASEVVQTGLDQWKNVQSSMCWYDDYGWWGIAFAKAFDDKYADVFGAHRSECQALATHCWDLMHTGKPNAPAPFNYTYLGGPRVWDNRDETGRPGYFTSTLGWAQPRYQGGVWQYDLFASPRPQPPECTPNKDSSNDKLRVSDPKLWECPLGPYQLTVMNGLYFVLALRLALQKQGTGTAAAAKTEHDFLKSWFSTTGDESLLLSYSDGSLLVRERVATYDLLEGVYPQVEGYHSSDAWCGDQGLMLGGLLDYLSFDSSNPDVESQATSIASGVLLHMVDDDGVMPYSNGYDVHGDKDDYSCGSGVFWRYLLRGFHQNPTLHTKVLDLVTSNPEKNAVFVSAEQAFVPVPSNGNKLFAYFNVLSVLMAALEILGEVNGVGSDN